MTQTKEEILTETYDAWHKEMSDKHIAFPLTIIREAFERVEQATIMRCIEATEDKREMEDYDVMVCSKCTSVVRERTSHNSEDGFSTCCGQKLVRKQGKKDTYSCYNEALNDVITSLKALLQDKK